MLEYTIYYKQTDGMARVYNVKTKEFNTIHFADLYQIKKRYAMLTGYQANDKELLRFCKDFKIWISEIKENDIFKFDYLKYSSHETVCVDMFKKLCHGKYEDMEDIDDIEYKYIEACNNAGVTYCNKGKHQCFGYDYSSQYPSILATEHFHIPTKRGKEQTIKELPNYPKVGFYKVCIASQDSKFNKIWNYSAAHVYTNYSIAFAKKCQKEGYRVDINLVDCENNCYIYGDLEKTTDEVKNGVIKCSKVFCKWYRYLFELKKTFPKNKLVKFMTSSLWGRLCEYNRLMKTEDELEKNQLDFVLDYDPNHKYYVRAITYSSKRECDVYELIESKRPYRFNIARIKPFLISKSRALVGAVAMEYIDDVVRIHTDNVTFNKEHDDVVDKFTTKAMTLSKEEKTTGLIRFRGVATYRNYTNDEYTTKNYTSNTLEQDDILDDLYEDEFFN
jgi:hypothetical protein